MNALPVISWEWEIPMYEIWSIMQYSRVVKVITRHIEDFQYEKGWEGRKNSKFRRQNHRIQNKRRAKGSFPGSFKLISQN